MRPAALRIRVDSSSVQDASERSPSPYAPRRSSRFIRPWCVASTAGCSRRAPRPRSPDRKGRVEALIQAIVELKSRNPRFGCPRIARIISQTFGIDIDKNIVYRVLAKHYRPAPGGTGPSWLAFIGHTTDSLWSVDLFRCESIVLRSYWVLVVMDQFTRRLVGFGVHCGASRAPTSAACSTPPFMGRAHRDISVPIRSAVRSAPVDGEPSDSGDRRNQDRAARAAVTPLRGALDWDDAARISRPGAVLECP